MLQDKYLPRFDFASAHSIVVNAPVSEIYPTVRDLRINMSPVVYWLMKLRGMSPPKYFSLQALENSRFVKLDEIQDREIILGIIGQPWTPAGNLRIFQPNEFVSFTDPNFIKASWSFELVKISDNQTEVKTETRITCPTVKTRRMFGFYWSLIKPFSGRIRKEMLNAIKKELEHSS
ncbi:MAG: hypothetical protein KF687_00480 [Cyclobacteriaceae bacterium]|nr:hypothetical protein [Cyclobacteriaceae bacterium]